MWQAGVASDFIGSVNYLPDPERVVWHRRSLDSISAVDRKLILC